MTDLSAKNIDDLKIDCCGNVRFSVAGGESHTSLQVNQRLIVQNTGHGLSFVIERVGNRQ